MQFRQRDRIKSARMPQTDGENMNHLPLVSSTTPVVKSRASKQSNHEDLGDESIAKYAVDAHRFSNTVEKACLALGCIVAEVSVNTKSYEASPGSQHRDWSWVIAYSSLGVCGLP